MKLYEMATGTLFDPGIYVDQLKLISEERKRKIALLKRREDRCLSLAAGILVDKGLQEYGLREKTMQYGYGIHGKPFFKDFPEIYFNISHSKEHAIAVFSNRCIGCDIEHMEPIDLSLAERFFSRAEYAELKEQAGRTRQRELFFRLWTLKESFLKAVGKGMAIPLDAFTIRLQQERIEMQGAAASENYHFWEYDQLPDYRIACCSKYQMLESGMPVIHISV